MKWQINLDTIGACAHLPTDGFDTLVDPVCSLRARDTVNPLAIDIQAAFWPCSSNQRGSSQHASVLARDQRSALGSMDAP